MDPTAEINKLRQQLHSLTAEAATNESILKRYQHRELELLTASSLLELLQRLVDGMGDSFGLHAVTLVIRDPEHEVRHLLTSAGHDPDTLSSVLFVDSLHGMTPVYGTMQNPWLGPYVGADHQLLFPSSKDVRSIAVLPLKRSRELAGSLNLGSDDAERFTRHHATDFLAHLAVIAGFCLENAINRERLLRAGMTDVLTGWHNRRYLQSRLKEEIIHARRHQQPMVALLVDVDEFKSINDNYGHLAGDNLLKEVANRIKGQIRGSDVAARYGGDEFAVLLPHTKLIEGAQLAERILAAVTHKPIHVSADSVTVTLSIGVAEDSATSDLTDPEKIAENLIADADIALYRAKSEGRNRVRTTE